jgi:pSer/pThr/pTyr-binding forkhead associated (FHA) protein
MPFQLVVVQGGRSSTPAVKIGVGATTVGRQEDCQFRIASSMVSRRHCQIVEHEGKLYVKDLGSSNGTVVNGKKVLDQQVLSPGDRLTIGPVTFRVEAAGEAGSAAKPGKAGDTAVAVAVEVGDEDLIALDIQDETVTDRAGVAPKGPAHAVTSAHVSMGNAGAIPLADAPADAEPMEVGEDAVVDFLLNIELDEDDKP